MPLYEVAEAGLELREPVPFVSLRMYERADIQRLLRSKISVLDKNLLVIAEEFGEWEDARRRIDLLALDTDGRLVVIEIKRTDDGGHMELQAIRYAAMVSSMDFPQVLAAFSAHCAKHWPDGMDPRAEIEKHLGTEPGEEPVISSDVRIILVSMDLGREITTAVLWLNSFDGMDIRCVRLVPYELEGKVIIHIEQIIPLPAAADYQVKLRRKDAARTRARPEGEGPDWTPYSIVVEGTPGPPLRKRQAIREMVTTLVTRGISIADVVSLMPSARIKTLAGLLQEPDAVRAGLEESYPGIDVARWFYTQPIVDETAQQTYVISKMWGLDTEPTLEKLSRAFPEAKVSYRRGDEAEE